MNFELTARCKDHLERVQAFIDKRIYQAEPVASSDAANIQTRIERDGDEYVIQEPGYRPIGQRTGRMV